MDGGDLLAFGKTGIGGSFPLRNGVVAATVFFGTTTFGASSELLQQLTATPNSLRLKWAMVWAIVSVITVRLQLTKYHEGY